MKKKLLTGKQKSYLRGLGHHLVPIAMIGQNGLTKEVLAAINAVLAAHELVKIKVQNTAAIDRHEAAESVAGQTGAQLVQVIGRSILLYKANQDMRPEKRIILP
ncbi:MAG: ribosome assembly RNA-binding protein YhbY [Desulfobulbaceae bacterium]|jgi:RNA-binding protein|nr:ribosome assembly RNA-binding protein YhbY [Desulfobulbaceae bacterium]